MFYHLEGVVSAIEQNMVVLDCGGIGFALNATLNTIAQLNVGQKQKLFIFEAIGETNFDLYGFTAKSEKRCFEMLISVSGIGPKAALSILSHSSPESLALAVMNSDEKALTIAPGIGKKIAQRVILELRDKVGKELGTAQITLPVASTPTAFGGAVNDAVAGLSVLGYGSSEITAAIKKIDVAGMTAEQIIKSALKQMLK